MADQGPQTNNMSEVQTGWKHSNTLKMTGADGSPERANSNETISGSIMAKLDGSNMKKSVDKGHKNHVKSTNKY